MQDQNQSVLSDNRIGRLLIKLTIPAFFGMFVMTLYNVIDTVFIGHYVGPLGIAGLSIVFPIQMLGVGIGQMMGMGGGSLISRLIGADRISRAEHTLGNAITGSLILSSVLITVCYFKMDYWLKLIGASDTILPYAKEYLRIILIGMLFKPLGMALNGLIRAEGNTHVPMKGMIIGAILNIILDAIFIIPLKMGITGAALATIISQIIVAVYFVGYFFRGKSFLKLHYNKLIISWHIIRDIFSIGIASFAMTIAGSTASVFVNRILIFYGGDLYISAYGIIQRIMMIAFMPGMVIGQGLQPILGYNYGAELFDKALKSIWLAFKYATICGVIVFAVLFFFPGIFINIFTRDGALINISIHAAKRIFIMLPLIGFMMVGSVIFQAIGKAVQSIITSVSRSVLFLIPMIYLLPQFMQAEGIWLAFPITDILTCVLTAALLIPQLRYFKSRIPTLKTDTYSLDLIGKPASQESL